MEEIENFLKYLAAVRGCSPTTIVTYDVTLRQLRAFVLSQDEAMEWRYVDSDLVRLWVADRMSAGIKPPTIRRGLCALRTFFRYLMSEGVVAKNPMDLIPNPKSGRPLPVYLRESEMDRLLDDVGFMDDFDGHRDHLILLTFYSTGIRASELIGIDVGDVDFSRAELRVLGKRNKHRIVPFGDELATALRHYAAERELVCGTKDGAFFVNDKGERLTYAVVRQIVRKYLSLVTNVSKRSPHVLRHTFATVMLNHGADLEAVRNLLGHDSIATTQIYTHTNFREMQKAYAMAHPHGHAEPDVSHAEPPVPDEAREKQPDRQADGA